MIEHECPCCGDHFLGRKNKVYCSSECKIHTNNERARSRLTWAIPIEKKLRQNRWPAGNYRGRVALLRGNRVLHEKAVSYQLR